MAATSTSRGGLRRAFSHRNFVIYTSGNFPSQIGVWAQRLAIGYLAWEWTGSGFVLGLIGFADLIPIVLLNPFAGYFTDRFDRLTLARLIQLLNVLVTGCLTFCAYAGWLNIQLLVLFAFLTGIDHALFQPVRSALASVLVPPEDLAPAIAFGGLSWNSARFVGPAVGGFLLTIADAKFVFLINALLYFWFYCGLWLLRLSAQPKRKPTQIGVFGEILAGYRYAFRHPVIGPMFIMLGTTSFLVRPVVELLPGFAVGVFERGPEGLAWLTSAMGIGAMASSLWVAQRGRSDGLAKYAVHSLLISMIFLILFAYSPRFEIAVLCMAAVGIQYSLFATCIQVVIQSVAEEHMRGRVLALYGMLWIGMAAFGALATGGLSDFIGLRFPIALDGGLIVLLWLWSLRAQRRMNPELEKREIL